MSKDEIQAAIERLRAIPEKCQYIVDVSNAFMGCEYIIYNIQEIRDFRDALIELLETARDSVPLPKDANGETIHLGDVMQWPEGDRLTVVGIGLGTLFYVDADGCQWTSVSNKTHYHEPTVEEVLREFAEKITDSQIPNTHPTYEEAIAEYAERLALKEGVQA